MAFPSTGILDSFTGADETPVATNWTSLIWPDDFNGLKRASNALTTNFQGDLAGSYYDIATFGPDIEAFMTLVTIGHGSDQFRLALRISDPGLSTMDGYDVRWSNFDDTVTIFRWNNNTSTQLAQATSVTFADGDKLGASAIGATLKAYKFTGGSWSEVLSHTDSSPIVQSGYVGAWMGSGGTTQPVIDDFGGGTSTRIYKRFYGPAQLTGSAATLYTCGVGGKARILQIHASNPSGSPVDLNLSIGADAAATRVYDDFEISADSVETNYDAYDLAAGDTIQGWASTASTVVLTISGYEDPA